MKRVVSLFITMCMLFSITNVVSANDADDTMFDGLVNVTAKGSILARYLSTSPGNAFDGSMDTFWTPGTDTNKIDTLCYSFARGYEVKKIVIKSNYDYEALKSGVNLRPTMGNKYTQHGSLKKALNTNIDAVGFAYVGETTDSEGVVNVVYEIPENASIKNFRLFGMYQNQNAGAYDPAVIPQDADGNVIPCEIYEIEIWATKDSANQVNILESAEQLAGSYTTAWGGSFDNVFKPRMDGADGWVYTSNSFVFKLDEATAIDHIELTPGFDCHLGNNDENNILRGIEVTLSTQLDGVTPAGTTEVIGEITADPDSNMLMNKKYYYPQGEQKYDYVIIKFPKGSNFAAVQNVLVYAKPENIGAGKDYVYVSVNGNDNGNGTAEQPFKTIKKAQEYVRSINKNMIRDIIVEVGAGVYTLDEPLRFDNRDSGTNGYNVIYRAAEDKKVVLSGGKRISGFKEGENGIWYAKSDDFEHIRNVTVNGKTALMAQTAVKIKHLGDYDDLQTEYAYDGVYVDYNSVKHLIGAPEMEASFVSQWVEYRMKIMAVEQDPDNSTQAIIKFQQPYYNIGRSNAISWMNDISFTLYNNLELLDSVNEFYFDRQTKILYYKPENGVNMTNAEVYGAVLETVIDVQGDSIYNHTENIVFDGFIVRDTKVARYETQSFISGQSQQGFSSGINTFPPGAIDVDNASNIRIENCIITGIGGVGIDLAESVYDTEITGNAIYDIGDSAAVVGRPWHSGIEEREPKNPGGPKNIFGGKPFSFSSLGKEYSTANLRGEIATSEYIPTSIPADANGFLGTSKDEADAGKLGWFKIDLLKEYLIDNIEFRYGVYEELGKSEMGRQNFQILLSNDPEFNEYEILYEQGEKSAERTFAAHYEGEGKYRYVMIRKTKPEPLIVGYVHVYSWDEPNERTMDPCKNITFKNNYITRVGNYTRMSPGISAFYLDTFNIENNEIYYVPYSAISLGWGWERNTWQYVAKKYTVKGNRIESWNNECYDGGAVYMLGNMPETVLTENYFRGGTAPYGAIYHDAGASGITSFDNVAENVTLVCNIGETNKNVHTYNTYTNIPNRYGSPFGDVTANSFPENNALIEPPINYVAGNEPEKVWEIKKNAGLEKEYRTLTEIVPENTLAFGQTSEALSSNVYDALTADGGYDFINKSYVMGAEYILNNSSFGNLPGQFMPDLYFKLNSVIEESKVYSTEKKMSYAVNAKNLLNVLNESEKYRNKLGYNELLDYCNNLINTGAGSKYTQENINLFEEKISEIEQADISEYQKIAETETALIELYNKGVNTDVLGAAAFGRIATVDAVNRKITFLVSNENEMSKVDADFLLPKGAYLSVDTLNVLDLSKPVNFKVYTKNGSESSEWTMEAKITFCDKQWYNKDRSNALSELVASEFPYIYTQGRMINSADFSFEGKADAGVSMIFGAKKPEIWSKGISAEDNHYEVIICGNTIALNKVVSGVATRLDSNTIATDVNKHSVSIIENNGVITVSYNGIEILHTMPEFSVRGCYVGIRPHNAMLKNVTVSVDHCSTDEIEKIEHKGFSELVNITQSGGILESYLDTHSERAFDGKVTTYWTPGTENNKQDMVALSFNRGYEVKKVIIKSNYNYNALTAGANIKPILGNRYVTYDSCKKALDRDTDAVELVKSSEFMDENGIFNVVYDVPSDTELKNFRILGLYQNQSEGAYDDSVLPRNDDGTIVPCGIYEVEIYATEKSAEQINVLSNATLLSGSFSYIIYNGSFNKTFLPRNDESVGYVNTSKAFVLEFNDSTKIDRIEYTPSWEATVGARNHQTVLKGADIYLSTEINGTSPAGKWEKLMSKADSYDESMVHNTRYYYPKTNQKYKYLIMTLPTDSKVTSFQSLLAFANPEDICSYDGYRNIAYHSQERTTGKNTWDFVKDISASEYYIDFGIKNSDGTFVKAARKIDFVEAEIDGTGYFRLYRPSGSYVHYDFKADGFGRVDVPDDYFSYGMFVTSSKTSTQKLNFYEKEYLYNIKNIIATNDIPGLGDGNETVAATTINNYGSKIFNFTEEGYIKLVEIKTDGNVSGYMQVFGIAPDGSETQLAVYEDGYCNGAALTELGRYRAIRVYVFNTANTQPVTITEIMVQSIDDTDIYLDSVNMENGELAVQYINYTIPRVSDIAVYIAAYDENNRVQEVKQGILYQEGAMDTYIASITNKNATTVKGFLWNNKGMPLYPVIE